MIMTNNFVLICISSPHWFLIYSAGQVGPVAPGLIFTFQNCWAEEGREGQQLHSMRNAPHTASHIFVINSPEVRPRHTRDGERIIHLDLPGPPDFAFVCEIIPTASASRKQLRKISEGSVIVAPHDTRNEIFSPARSPSFVSSS